MKRPEKKDPEKYRREHGVDDYDMHAQCAEAYNRACDNWEKFLPSKDEITKMVDKKLVTSVGTSIIATSIKNSLIEVIAKRLGVK